MARDGSGNYNLPAGQPVVTGTTISSAVHNTLAADVAAALTQSLSKDGQTTPTANLPMGTFKHTGVGDATLRTQYQSAGQAQDRGPQTIGSIAGTADAITGSLNPSITAYVQGMLLAFEPTATNTGAATIQLNGLAVRDIRKGNNVPLVAGDLINGAMSLILYDGTSGVFSLINPQTSNGGGFTDGTVGAPSIAFAADPNTGFYRIGADLIGIACGGSLKVQISNAASAEVMRFIARDTIGDNFLAFFEPDNTTRKAYLGFGNTGSDEFDIMNEESADLRLGTAGVTRLTVNSSGVFGAHPFRGVDGSVGAPTFAFTSDGDTGIYSEGAGTVAIAANGSRVAYFANFAGNLQIAAASGTAARPLYSFNADVGIGMFYAGTNILGFSVAGVNQMSLTNAQLSLVVDIEGPDGAVGNPTYSFFADPDTGFYRPGSGGISASSNGAEVARFLSATGGGLLVADYGGTLQVAGFREVPQNAQAGNYTLVLGDSGKHIYHGSGDGAGDTYTIPANGSVAYPLGTMLTFINSSASTVAIAITTDTMTLAGTTTTGTRTLAQNGVATAVKVTSTSWIISGTGLT